jgi:putative ABC transport system substrate-binding protein
MMKRGDFITLLGGTAAAWPLAARAQNGKAPVRLGFVPLGSPSNAYDLSLVEAFRQGLNRVGLIENRDIILDVAWVSGNPDQAVSDVLRRGAELLIPCGSSASVAAKRQTSNPCRSERQVGGPFPGAEQAGNGGRLSLVYRLAGRSKSLPSHPAGCPSSRNEASIKRDRRVGELDDALMRIKQSGSTTLIVQPSPFTYGQRGRIIASAMKNGLGTIFAFPVAAREGSLIAYGPDYLHMYRRAPLYVDRVLKGTQPADLPVEQPAKVELLVNLQSAKSLDIEVPLSLLIRADELLE